MIKKGDAVKIVSTGKFGIITSIQDVHNRYKLLGVSGWRYGIKELEKQNFESLLAEIERKSEVIEILEIENEKYRNKVMSFFGEGIVIRIPVDKGEEQHE